MCSPSRANRARVSGVDRGVGAGRAAALARRQSAWRATLDNMAAALEQCPRLNPPLRDPQELWDAVSPVPQSLGPVPWTWRLRPVGKINGQPLWKHSLSAAAAHTDYTIGIDSIDVMVQDAGVSRLADLQIKPHATTWRSCARSRPTPCSAWMQLRGTSRKRSAIAGPTGVEFIEQPLKPDQWEGMKEVLARSALPVIADESCQVEPDVDRCRASFTG